MAKVSAWEKKIRVAWQKSRDAIFEVGDLLIAAKQELPHGQFQAMVENALPFGPRTAERLMAIAADKRLRNPTHVSHLPCSWGTLYELTKLSDGRFAELLTDGTINSEMMRSDIMQVARPRIDLHEVMDLHEVQASASRPLVITHEAAPPQGLRIAIMPHGGPPQTGAAPNDLACQVARERALRIWDVLRHEGSVDAGLSQQFRLLASERPQEVEAVREAIDGLAAALATRAS
jgi:hypothetical protein